MRNILKITVIWMKCFYSASNVSILSLKFGNNNKLAADSHHFRMYFTAEIGLFWRDRTHFWWEIRRTAILAVSHDEPVSNLQREIRQNPNLPPEAGGKKEKAPGHWLIFTHIKALAWLIFAVNQTIVKFWAESEYDIYFFQELLENF